MAAGGVALYHSKTKTKTYIYILPLVLHWLENHPCIEDLPINSFMSLAGFPSRYFRTAGLQLDFCSRWVCAQKACNFFSASDVDEDSIG